MVGKRWLNTIWGRVAGTHMLVLAILYLLYLPSCRRQTPPPSIRVGMVEASMLPTAPPSPQRHAEPKPEPEVKQKPPVKAPPKPKPRTKIKQPKALPKPKSKPKSSEPKPKPPVKKQVKKPVKVAKKPTYNSVADIRKRIAAQKPKDKPKATVDVNKVAQQLKTKMGKYETTAPTSTNAAAQASRRGAYRQLLAGELHRRWQQPNRSELTANGRSVRIALTVRNDGKVLAAKVLEASSNAAMDGSVRTLLQSLQQLPPFPEEMTERQFHTEVVLKVE